MRRTFRYRLYPTGRQAAALTLQLGDACDLYNAALEHRRRLWTEHGVSVSYGEQSAELRDLRACGLRNADANFWSQQAVPRRLDRAFQAFYRRCKTGESPGYPRFRSRRRYDTLDLSFAGNAGGVAVTKAGRLRVQGVGHIKVKQHRPIAAGATLCEARVTRRASRWYVAISLDNVPARPLAATGRQVGAGKGLSHSDVARLVNGDEPLNPHARKLIVAAFGELVRPEYFVEYRAAQLRQALDRQSGDSS